MIPLAQQLRPTKLDDIVGQQHLIGEKGVITRLVNSNKLVSLILYGRPGIGKTTIANVICSELKINNESFNASIDNKAKLVSIIENAKKHDRYVIIVDEIHRMKKDIQDYLLPHLEAGNVIMIGLTTINPYHSVNPAVRSRCMIYKLNEIKEADLEIVLHRAFLCINKDYKITDDAKKYLIKCANGEVRSLINFIETLSYFENREITLDDCLQVVQKAVGNIDKNEDSYFETLSGLQKSIRGSDVNASLHYLCKLLLAEDLLSIARRLTIMVYEDIGLANPSMGPKVKAACDVALDVGLPEAILPLGTIVCDMALSPKSNSAYLAVNKAYEDVKNGNYGPLPPHLKNTYSFDGNHETYKYPHEFPGSWVDQQYLPDKIKDVKYYEPKDSSKYEIALKERYEAINNAKKKK